MVGKSAVAFIWVVMRLWSFGWRVIGDIDILEKLRKQNKINSYRQPTQVDKSRRLRGARERSLRNSAKQLGVILRDALPIIFGYIGRSEWYEVDCLPKTQVYANSKEEVYGLKPDRCQKIKESGFSFGKGLRLKSWWTSAVTITVLR